MRRRWPEMLISWTRVLSGRIREARIGRDVLLGALAGSLMAVVRNAVALTRLWFHEHNFVPSFVAALGLRGSSAMIALFCATLGLAVQWALAAVSFALVMRTAVRNETIAVLMTVAVLGMIVPPDATIWLAVVAGISAAAIAVALLFRAGFLSLATALFYFQVLGPLR